MKEIGGYIELDTYKFQMMHEKAVPLNCGRNCLAYLIMTKKIKKLVIPYFLCDSVACVCKKYGVKIRYYHITENFLPKDLYLDDDEWLYIVNFYGQISKEQILIFKNQYSKIILDYAQAYFEMPLDNIASIYTCRKFFGVADGAFLYTDELSDREFEVDESFERMRFLMGRYERTASDFYADYVENNKIFCNEPIKKMSKLTYNLLHAIDYKEVENIRTKNFRYLQLHLKSINKLELKIPKGAFMYPLYVSNGTEIRKKLQRKNIYIPTLWSDVFNVCDEKMLEYDMAKNILPLPIDQRYDEDTMKYLCGELFECL